MSFNHLFMPLIAQAAAAAPKTALPWYQETWFNVLVALLVLVMPFVAGSWLAKQWRMNDYAWRIGLLLFSLTAGIVVCIAGWPPRLGIDLSGGVILVYEVDQSKSSDVDLAGVADQVRKELSTGGLDATVSPVGGGRLEVSLPGADAAETTKVEKRLAEANFPDTELVVEARPLRDGKQILVYNAKKSGSIDMDRMVSAIGKRVNPGGQKEVTIRRMGSDRVEVIIPQAEPAEVDVIKEKISTAGALQFRILANRQAHLKIIEMAADVDGRDLFEKDAQGNIAKDEHGIPIQLAQWVVLDPDKFKNPEATEPKGTIRQNKKGEWERLVVITPFDVSGGYLSRSFPTHDDKGLPAVGFSFNTAGAQLFGSLTGNHLPDKNSNLEYHLGIVLDGKLMSAPRIESTITNNGIIHGNFTDPEVQFLVDILNAGSLPAALSKIPVAEYTASAQLGSDTIRAGAFAMIIGTLSVLVFMQVFYRFAGFVANLAVLMNLVLVMGMMILIKAHLTLAGLAGLVLSVGMAVDSNVLIYERMREELERGAALRMAIRNGFARAMTTIIDSHCTTLISGVVLYAVGTDQLRGFATTLVLGLVFNLFTAVYCARVVFDVAERKRWLTELRMMKLVGKTNFDFLGWVRPAAVMSIIVIAIGMGAVAIRGAGLFGIDFTGGTAVQVAFKEPTDIAYVRKTVAELPDVSVSAVASAQGQEPNTRFNIDTSYQGDTASGAKSNTETIKEVKDKLKNLFTDKLKRYSMEIVSVGPAEAPKLSDPAKLPGAKSTDEPKGAEGKSAEKKSDEKSSAGPSAEKASAESKATDAKSTEGKATNEKSLDGKSADRPAAEEASAEKPSNAPAADAAPTLAKLRFPDGINYASLEAMLHEAHTAAMVPDPIPDLTSPDPDYTPGSSLPVEDWNVRLSLNREQTKSLLSQAQQALADTPVFPSANNIGGKVAGDTKLTAVYALIVSNLLIVLFVWVRYQNLIFGVAAVIAELHDVAVTIGVLALSYWLAGPLGFLQIDQFKISLEVVAALLTIVGYSINDKIVIFDRVREIRGKSKEISASMINLAVNQTLSRTILTGGAVILVTLILFIWGGEGIHAFAFAMFVGLITGTYSSVFIAAPILLWFQKPTTATGNVRKSSLDTVRATGAA